MVAAAAASTPGLRVHELLRERNSRSVLTQAKDVARLVQADAVSGTPTLFVGKTGRHGTRVALRSSTDEAALVQAIRAALTS